MHLGEHSLKGIKGKEQIVQLLPITLAGRKFPPLNTGEAKTTHFEEQSAPPKKMAINNNATSIASVKSGMSFAMDEEESERDGQQSPTRMMPQVFSRMREVSQILTDPTAQVRNRKKERKKRWERYLFCLGRDCYGSE